MEAIEAKQIHIRFTRALSSYDNHADAQHRISRKLASLLPHQANIRYKRMLEIGCGTGGFTGVLKQQCHIDEWILNDLCEDCQEKIEQLFPGSPPRFIAGDAETLSFPGKFDLIASASVFQWMKEPETFLHKLSGLLMQQGLLLFSTFVPGNLYEIKELTGKGLVYPTSDTLVGWLSTADFNLLHQEEDTIVLTFKTPLDVLRHLKATGVTATGNGCWTKGRQESFCRQYAEQFATTDGQVTHIPPALYISNQKIKKDMKGTVLFITGIDTNIGKTFATGMIACALAEKGKKVITQKMIQTGCTEVSEDIEMHRKIQGIPFTEEDKAGLTCPYIFTYPCSPHMAAEKDGKTIDLSVITEATRRLQEKYEYVLLEGAGGLMVPNDFHSLAIDYVKEQGYPVILVTSGKLGSINHTLLSLYACKQYGIPVRTVVYNLYPPTDELITANTLEYLTQYLEKEFPETALITLPEATAGVADIDISSLF